MMPKVVFVACVAEKQDAFVPARELYQSVWFKKARAYAEKKGDQWYILSAEYGVLSPGQYVGWYNKTLNEMKAEERRLWALKCYEWIRRNINYDYELVFLAGKYYRDPLCIYLDNHGYFVSVPMKGLGIGQQLSWLDKQLKGE